MCVCWYFHIVCVCTLHSVFTSFVTTTFCLSLYGDHRVLHVLTHSFPTLRSSDLARWPGFLTGFDGERQVVKTRADDAPVPMGAVLEGDRKSTRLNSSH